MFCIGKHIVEKTVDTANQTRCCLSDEQIIKLAKIGVFLENLYGNARDIEWALYQVFIRVISAVQIQI